VSSFNYIAVEGALASGKTPLARFLAEKSGADLLLDDAQGNLFLADFYSNPARFAFSAQIFFLVSRYQKLKQLAEPDLFIQKKVADYIFARDEIFARLNLNQREYSLYQSLSQKMESEILSPDLVIYLQASAVVTQARIKERKTSYNSNLSLEYIEKLTQAFDQYFFHYSQTPLLIVNTNQLNLFAKEGDLELIVSEIEKTNYGTRYFAPASKDVLL